MIVSAIYSVLSMLIVIAVGFFFGGTEFFKKHDCGAVMTTYLKYIGIPVYMLYNAVTNFTSRSQLITLVHTLPYSLLTVGVAIAIGVLLGYALKIRPSRRGTFINACGFSNTVFIGLPVVTSMFGSEILPTGMMFYAANTLLFWTVGVNFLRAESGNSTKLFDFSNRKQLLAPPLIGFLTGVLIVALGITLPEFVSTAMRTIAGTSSPLGMMFVGSVIRTAPIKQGGMVRDIVPLLFTRIILLPGLLLGLMRILPIDIQMRQVFYMLATTPAMTQLGVMARDTGGDYPFASVWITVSTILGIGSIPLYAFIMERFLI